MKYAMSLLASCVCLSAVCQSRPAGAVSPRKAVQLDLASQMETVAFITNHMTRIEVETYLQRTYAALSLWQSPELAVEMAIE